MLAEWCWDKMQHYIAAYCYYSQYNDGVHLSTLRSAWLMGIQSTHFHMAANIVSGRTTEMVLHPGFVDDLGLSISWTDNEGSLFSFECAFCLAETAICWTYLPIEFEDWIQIRMNWEAAILTWEQVLNHTSVWCISLANWTHKSPAHELGYVIVDGSK